jgi:hypothetical protein
MSVHDLTIEDHYAVVLLRRILGAIGVVFPDVELTVEPHPDSNNIVFSIVGANSAYVVEVTESFLDADDGLTPALTCLESLRVQLRSLAAGDVLMVTPDGLEIQARPNWGR